MLSHTLFVPIVSTMRAGRAMPMTEVDAPLDRMPCDSHDLFGRHSDAHILWVISANPGDFAALGAEVAEPLPRPAWG